MNEFEHHPNETSNDVPHAVTGFLTSLVFFIAIFGIGSFISLIN